MQETQAELALLPEPDKIVTFDAVAAVVESLRAAIDSATPVQLRELMRMLIERIKVTGDGEYEGVEPVPAAGRSSQPRIVCFYGARTDSNRRRQPRRLRSIH